MNLYFISSHYIDLPISQLQSIASFRKLSIGDLVILRIDRRLVMVVINSLLTDNIKLTNFPMVAQTICEDKDLPKLLPILYYYDGFNRKIFDKEGLRFLLNVFTSDKLASKFVLETISLVNGVIDRRDTQLIIQLLKCRSVIPLKQNENIVNNKPHNVNVGKLLIVEKFFTSHMKQEFYDNITLGLTERESLVKLNRKYPKIFRKILLEFQDEDIYTRI